MERQPADVGSLDDAEVVLDPELQRALEENGKVGADWLRAQAVRNSRPGADLEPNAQSPSTQRPPTWQRPDPAIFLPVPQETVAAAVVGDAASRIDALGFEPYVKALAAFLTSSKTKPPLTVSIEGEWGSGKSSFMLQLRERIRNETDAPRSYFVEFNAWQYEKEEALWAAFALNFVRAMRRQVSPFAAIRANFSTYVMKFLLGRQGNVLAQARPAAS
jgi:hypothetical protein